MMGLTLNVLQNCFNAATEGGANFVAVVVTLPGTPGEEVIINGRENFGSKLEYYKNAYNEDLTHKHAAGVKIVGFTYGDSFEDIYKDLYGGEDTDAE